MGDQVSHYLNQSQQTGIQWINEHGTAAATYSQFPSSLFFLYLGFPHGFV